MTAGQRRALERDWPGLGLNVEDGLIDLAACFPRRGKLVLEIGFGMGDSLVEAAAASTDANFIGIEVHRPGVGHLLIKAREAHLDNLRVFNADTLVVLAQCIPDACLDRVQVFFPDPWPKKRHHKRRLVDRDFAELVCRKLVDGGMVHIATDWPPYAEAIREAFADMPAFEQVTPPARPCTKYEKRGLELGHTVADLAWRKRAGRVNSSG